jgi:hypothetical protein
VASARRAGVSAGEQVPPEGQRPEQFPEELWRWVAPDQQPLVAKRYEKYSAERLGVIIGELMTKLDIYLDDKVGVRPPWKEMDELVKEWTLSEKNPLPAGALPREQDFFRAQALANLDVFGAPDPDNPPRVKGHQIRIETVDERPCRARPRRYNLIQQGFLEAKTNIMVRQHKLRDTQSAWSHGLVLVPYHDRIQRFLEKHGENSTEELFKEENEAEVATFYRLCSDMREINSKTKLDIFPLPRIDDILDNIPQGTERFSTGDLMDAFFCVEVHPEDRHKLAFRTHNRHLEFEVLVMGWINSPSHFSRIIAQALDGIGRFKASAYMDDILNHTAGFSAHFQTQQEIYDRLRENQLMYKITKTKINHPSLRWLGHILSPEGRAPDPVKVEAIRNMEDPRDVTGVRSLLGMALFYRAYIPHFGDISMPLHALTRKGVNVKKVWKDEEHGAAVDAIKKALSEAPVLRLFDSTKPVQIRIDACKVGRGIGAILLQQDEAGEWHPVEYYSCTLSATERNYAATELECKALHDSLLHWHMYVNCGQKVQVYSDHNALKYMVTKATATNNGRLLHWLMDIQGYRFELHYKAGVLHSDADYISRAWHISDFVHESREELDTAIGLLADPKAVVERSWGSVNRQLKKIEKKRMNAVRTLDLQPKVTWVTKEKSDQVAQAMAYFEKFLGAEEAELASQPPKELINIHLTEPTDHGLSALEMPLQTCHSGRVLRTLPRVDYSDKCPCDPDFKTSPEHPASDRLRLSRRRGYKKLKILKSTRTGGGWGLFAGAGIKEGEDFCSYEGAEISSESTPEELAGKEYVASGIIGGPGPRKKGAKKKMMYIDSWDLYSCYGRYANDPIDASLVNAKILWTKDGLRLFAMGDIEPGEEIFVSYDPSYWRGREHFLCPADRELLEEARYDSTRRVRFHPVTETRPFKPADKAKESRPSISGVLQQVGKARRETQEREAAAAAEKEEARARELALEAECFEKYAYDGVIQCEELAVDLQYMVGQKFVDTDNGGLYEVSQITYNEEFGVVVGGKRAMDGKLRKYDDSMVCVFGRDGLLEMTDTYSAQHPADQAWPTTRGEMEHLQRADPKLREIIEKCKEDEESLSCEWERNTYRLQAGERGSHILVRTERIHRKAEENEQIVLPQTLWNTCLQMFHEGYSHPGSQRCLETIKIHYYWDSLRKDTIHHIRGCNQCRLRKSYQGRPAVPIMRYPAAKVPLERLHMDLTGALPLSKGGYSYIFVVKDHLTKFVWLFPLKTKKAEDIAAVLVEKLFCTFGLPQHLFSDKGSEFVNRLVARISLLMKVNRVSTTPYNPRSNGFVENHNKTLKDQLFHFVGVLQDTWDQFLPTVQLMYNTTVSSATQFTPFYLMFGRECNLADGEIYASMARLPDQGAKDDVERYINRLTWSLECAWGFAVGKAGTNFERFNALPKRRRKFCEYTEGQLFMRERRPVYEFKSADDEIKYHINAKLQARFDGPHKVIRKLSPILYEAEIEGIEKRISAVNMKPIW